MAAPGTQYRQGDLLLTLADRLPADLELVPLAGEPLLALMPPARSGPGTHLVPSGPALRAFRQSGGEGLAEWLQITGSNVTLTHPEHAPLTLEPGVWRVTRQRQYDPASPGAAAHRRVAD